MSTAVDPRSAEALREHDPVSEPAPSGGMKAAGGLAGWLDDRTGGAGFTAYLLKKTFPDHWTFMLGEIAMYTLIICLLTGTFLTFWFVPERRPGRLRRLLPAAAGHHDVRGLPLDASTSRSTSVAAC